MNKVGNQLIPVYTLYVGSRDGKAFPDTDRRAVTKLDRLGRDAIDIMTTVSGLNFGCGGRI